MCLLMLCGSIGLPDSGCVTTDRIEFQLEESFPPSIVSAADADYPLNQIGALNLDDPVEAPEALLQTVVRDPNFDETLEYRIFLDSFEPPPAVERPIQEGTIGPSGFLDRFPVFAIPFTRLEAGQCHKIELVVVGTFASGSVEPRRPVIPGDFDQVTWWIRVTDADEPLATECQ
ncbi:MAG: hypothetical protein WBG86_07315 [Polyangiales bacterium]